MFRNLIIKILLSCLPLLCLQQVVAAEINIYDQPKADAKPIAKIDLSTGVIPIYTPPNSEWIKVADPKNGNVGWAKSADVNASAKGGVYFTQRIINDGSGGHTYQVFQYGSPPAAMDNNQRQMMLKKFQMQQQILQKEMQDMEKQMNELYRQQWQLMNNANFPSIAPIPVIVVQPQSTQNLQKPASTNMPMQTSTTPPTTPQSTTSTVHPTPGGEPVRKTIPPLPAPKN